MLFGIVTSQGIVVPSIGCSTTIDSPGSLSGIGAAAMTISGQTVTSPDGTLRGAETSGFSKVTGTDMTVAEVHYDPADWVGGTIGGGIAVGDLVAGPAGTADLTGPGAQANTYLIIAQYIDGGTDAAVIINPTTGLLVDLFDSAGNISTISSWKMQVYSDISGGELTFVTAAENMNTNKAALDSIFGGTHTYKDVCGTEIFTI